MSCVYDVPFPFFHSHSKSNLLRGGKRALKYEPWSFFHALKFDLHSLMYSFPRNWWGGATDMEQRLTPKAHFQFLQLQNCLPPNSSPLFSCSLTFGQMCLHQMDLNLQGFPHKSLKPVYWALLSFLCQRDRFASLGEFSYIIPRARLIAKRQLWLQWTVWNLVLIRFCSCWFCSEELERARWGWDDINMAVSTQLGLLLWKNFTYRRRQTVSTVVDTVFPSDIRQEKHR